MSKHIRACQRQVSNHQHSLNQETEMDLVCTTIWCDALLGEVNDSKLTGKKRKKTFFYIMLDKWMVNSNVKCKTLKCKTKYEAGKCHYAKHIKKEDCFTVISGKGHLSLSQTKQQTYTSTGFWLTGLVFIVFTVSYTAICILKRFERIPVKHAYKLFYTGRMPLLVQNLQYERLFENQPYVLWILWYDTLLHITCTLQTICWLTLQLLPRFFWPNWILLLVLFSIFSVLILCSRLRWLADSYWTHVLLLLLQHPINGLFSGTTWVSRHLKGKRFWILLVQEMMGWQWHQLDHMQITCTSLQTDNHASTSPVRFL